MTLLLALLDVALTVVHSAVVVANLVLWLPQKTRRLHLGVVGLTAASWFGLGAFYGLGYCVLTDWHWQIKRARGLEPPSHSFIYYLTSSAGVDLAPSTVHLLTAVVFGVVVCLSLVLNVWALFRPAKSSERARRVRFDRGGI